MAYTQGELKIEKNLLELQKTGYPYNDWIIIKEEPNKKNENYVNRTYTLVVPKLTQYIRENLKYYFVDSATSNDSLIYVYADGYYKLTNENTFKGYIKQFIPYQLVKMREVNEIFQDLKTSLKNISISEFDTQEYLINFQDGILNLKDNSFIEHSPEYLMTIQIPAKYQEICSCYEEPVNFHNYMNTLVDNDEECYTFLLEYLGLTISNICGYRTKKSLFLVGQGDSGKSVIKRLAEEIVGENNISTIDLEKLHSQFGMSNLYQKRLAGCNDMSFSTIGEMSEFKQITGGDKINCEFKHRSSFPYLYKGVLWFNCNKLPLFGGDKGKWVYERIVPIECKNVIPKEKQDPLLFDKLWAEKNAIIKEALSYLKLLIADNFKFRIPTKAINFREEYKIENSTLLSFIEECCEVNDTEEGVMCTLRNKKSDFKRAYYRYCDINNYGKGKIKIKEIEETLKNKYNEDFPKRDGYECLRRIRLKKEAEDEYGY